MSRKLKILITSLSFVIASNNVWAQDASPLSQIPGNIANTLQTIADPSMTSLQRLQAISHQKSASEFIMREAILNGTADPNDLNMPQSATAQAFKSIDALTVLSELQVEPNSGKITPESCSRARGTLFTSNLKAAAEDIRLSGLDRQIESLINLMCGPK